MKINLIFPGAPRSKDNCKSFGRDRRGRVHAYLPAAYKQLEATWKARARLQLGGAKEFPLPKDRRLRVGLRFYYPYTPTTPDYFNAPKSILDAMNGVLWEDDAQIWEDLGGFKAHAPGDPRIELRMETIDRDATVDRREKFAEFDKMIEHAKSGGVRHVVVAAPWVLGDTYDELLVNLGKLARAGLTLAIAREE